MRKDFFKYAFLTLSLIFGLSLGAGKASAATCNLSMQPSEGIAGVDFLTFNKAIVPCGRSCDDARTTEYDEEEPCTLCHMLIMTKNIFDLMFAWLIIVAIIGITIGGVMYILSMGNPGSMGTAKGIIQKTLMGFVAFVCSWLIIYTVLVFVSASDDNLGLGGGSSWWQFKCEMRSEFSTSGGLTGPTPPLGGGSGAGSFDPGIAPQVADAHAGLTTFMDCMNVQIPDSDAAARRVSSISDSAGMAACTGAAYDSSVCAHREKSCHYGGQSCVGQSVAVDYGAEEYSSLLTNAAKACGQAQFGQDPYVLIESDHLHISIGVALGCGCN